jgi:hypothetical protein
MREITLLRVRTLVTRARGDDAADPDVVCRYHAMARRSAGLASNHVKIA